MANTFGPFGLRPVSYLNGTPWNSQYDQSQTIASEYANNIFQGDAVTLDAARDVINLFDGPADGAFPAGGLTVGKTPILGVFFGCQYTAPSGINGVDPAGPKVFWSAGSKTVGGVRASCSLIIDPNVVYEIQADDAAVTGMANRYGYAGVGISDTGGIVDGTTNLGNSTMFLDSSTLAATPAAAANGQVLNLRLLGLAPGYAGNGDGLPNNIWRVIIQNNFFNARNAA